MFAFAEITWRERQASLIRLRSDDEGQTLVEYALIIALVAVAVAASLRSVRDGIAAIFNTASTALNG